MITARRSGYHHYNHWSQLLYFLSRPGHGWPQQGNGLRPVKFWLIQSLRCSEGGHWVKPFLTSASVLIIKIMLSVSTNRRSLTTGFLPGRSSVVRPLPTSAIMDLNRIPSTTHGHEFHSGLSRVVMVRKTEQRTFASGKDGEVSHEFKQYLYTSNRQTQLFVNVFT